MVLPRPTSSASSTRGGRRAAAMPATRSWCGTSPIRAAPRPHIGERRASARRSQAFQAQFELRDRIGAATDQAIVGLAHALFVVELAFVQLAAFAAVDQQVVANLDALDQERDALAGDALAGTELGAQQRRRIHRVRAQHPGLGEQHLHAASFDAQYGAEAELGFGRGDPALTRYEHYSAALHQGPTIIRPAARGGNSWQR